MAGYDYDSWKTIEGFVAFVINPLPNSPEEKKQMLFELARSGAPKPKHGTILGNALHHYTDCDGKAYDAKFTKEMRKIRPEWVRVKHARVKDKKAEILRIARAGEPKPYWKSSLGKAITNYTNPKSDKYDHEFTEELKSLRPDWFKRRK